MKGVRLTKVEVAAVEEVNTLLMSMPCDTPKGWGGVVTKVRAAQVAPSGVAVKPIEDALIRTSHGKVLALEGGHAMASRRLTAMKVTEADAELVGAYMARQAWLTSPMTLLDVLNKWYQWLPKARATQPPPALQPGLGIDGTRQGPSTAGQAPPPGRTRPGFR